MHVKKSNKTQPECQEELSGRGQRNKAIRNLKIEKEKPVTVKTKTVSSLKYFPDRKELKIILPVTLTEIEIKEKFNRRLNPVKHNPFKRKDSGAEKQIRE